MTLQFNNPKKWVTIIFIIIFIGLLYSCGIKHKVSERKSENISLDKIEKVSEIEEKNIVTDSTITLKSEHTKLSKNTSIELKQADENKTIVIEDETGKKLTIKGADAVIKNTETKETTKDTSSIKVAGNDKSKTTTNKETETDFNKKSSSRQTDSKSIGMPFWIWIILIIVGVVGVGWWIKKKHPLM